MAEARFSLPTGWLWWTIDLETNEVRLDPALAALIGAQVTVAQLIANVHPDDRARIESEYNAAVSSQTAAPVLMQFHYHCIDGSTRRFASAAGLTYRPTGAARALTGITADLEQARGDGTRLFRLQRLYNVLLAVNQAMIEVSNAEELLVRTCRILVERGGFAFASVLMVDNGLATRLASSGAVDPALDGNRAAQTDAAALGWLPRPPELWVSNDLEREVDLGPTGVAYSAAGYRSLATLPLVHQGEVAAALMIRCHDRQAFGQEEIELLRQLAAGLDFAWSKLGQVQRLRRTLFEEATDAMLVIDSEQALVDVNQAAARLLGYSREELSGLSMRALTPAEDPLRASQGSQAQVRQRSLRRKDGVFVPVEVSKRLVGDGLMQVIVRDLTERKRLESQLVLADRLVSLGTLASGVAHELNNPLSWIISNLSQANRLLEELPESSARAELVELMTESLEGAHRIVSVVSDLKTYSRPDSPIARVSLHRVIERSVQVLGIQARYRGKLLKQLEVVPDVIGTEAQLGQVFINLLLNAVQALPEGRPDSNEVTIACFTGGAGEAVVEVRDTGCGIEAQVLPRIFDPFFTTKPPGLGTGLGLSVIYNIVTGLGGRVEVRSTVGTGSTFRVVLPPAKTACAGPSATGE